MKSDVKERARSVLDPLVTFMASSGVHPNVLTVVGLVFAIVAGASAARGAVREAGVWLIVSGIFDMTDGAVARHLERSTRRGAFLDSTLDRYAEGAFFAGLLWHYLQRGDADLTVLGLMLALLGSLLVSYVRARAEGLGVECTVGLMERPERLVLLIVGALIAGPVLPLVIWAVAILANVTAVHRIVHVYRKLEG